MSLSAPGQLIGGFLRRIDWRYMLLLLAGSVLALLIRVSLLEFKTGDFLTYRQWYFEIQDLGFRAFRNHFAAYNPPYLYMLYLIARFAPSLPSVVAVKLPSIVSDFLCAASVHQIVRLKGQNPGEALLAYMAVLLAPTVILNSSLWGQTDSIYLAGLLASLYGVLSRRPWLATIAFGVALAIKLQAVFFFPFLLALSLRKELPWKHWVVVPAILILALLPAWLVGRPISSLAATYPSQTETFNALTLYAPNLYAWLPSAPGLLPLLLPAGLLFALAAIAIYVLLIAHSRVKLTPALAVQLAALCVMLVPFVTPEMHERYYFAADVITIVYAFYFASSYYIPLIVILSSFFSYIAVLFSVDYHLEPFPQSWLALAMLVALAIMVRRSLTQLYPAVPPAVGTEPDNHLPGA